jgi:phosphopentomutase
MGYYKRVFLIVLDSLGIGYQPDAHRYGDEGANTLERISHSEKFQIPNLLSLGLGLIDGVGYLEKTDSPKASYARLREVSQGKDTTVGHFELMGIVSEKPFPTYPNGFPKSIISRFSELTGRGVLCNKPYSGTEVIRDFGAEHLKSGKLIVYTSADSVFQIAAHEDIVPPEELYRYCEIARELLVGEHGVGRVIARPFIGRVGEFTRTANRRDFSIKPPTESALDLIKACGLDVIAVGKINDIFAGQGITEAVPTHSNAEGIAVTRELLSRDFSGLAFINLVDFDMLYGHRQDVDGYAAALSEFDRALGDFLPLLKAEDVLIITADHGCDPGDKSTDHTREYVPLLFVAHGIEPQSYGTRIGFFEVGNAILKILGVKK